MQDRPKTAPSNGNGSIAVRKSRSLKQGSTGARSVRERSNSRTKSIDGSISGAGGLGLGIGNGLKDKNSKKARKPDFSGFLDSIDAGDGDDEELDLSGVGRAPY